MSDKRFDVLGIGNAIVDIISQCDDSLLTELHIPKGHMQLIEADQADALYQRMGPAVETSGGSVANSCAGLASFGAQTAFIGKVADDQFGKIFAHDINSIGVTYNTPLAQNSAPTAKCMIFVTPDSERTMNTYLGVSVELGKGEIDADMIKNSDTIYLEGYLFDKPEAKAAFHEAVKIAQEAGTKVALSLSDAFCVERHRIAFRNLIDDGVDILFANRDELLAVYKSKDLNMALDKVRIETKVAAITDGANGSLIATQSELIEIAPQFVDMVKDTTGAGDQYAAGFLFGYAKGMPLQKCGELASLAASEVISHFGARPQKNLADLAKEQGIL